MAGFEPPLRFGEGNLVVSAAVYEAYGELVLVKNRFCRRRFMGWVPPLPMKPDLGRLRPAVPVGLGFRLNGRGRGGVLPDYLKVKKLQSSYGCPTRCIL